MALQESSELLALTVGGAMIAPIVLIDHITHNAPVFRLAYLFPVCRGASIGGRRAGFVMSILSGYFAVTQTPSALTRIAYFLFAVCAFTYLSHLVGAEHDKLRKARIAAETDALTGAANRPSIERTLQEQLGYALRSDELFHIAMIDCDKFKALNDVHGHAFGDQVLRVLIQVLRRSLPSTATIGRLGGDEFIVILPNQERTDVEQALAIAADRFRDSTLVMGHATSFSTGLAGLRTEGFSRSELLEAADRDMYLRKAMRSFSDSGMHVA